MIPPCCYDNVLHAKNYLVCGCKADHVWVSLQIAHSAVVLHIVHSALGNAANGRLCPVAL